MGISIKNGDIWRVEILNSNYSFQDRDIRFETWQVNLMRDVSELKLFQNLVQGPSCGPWCVWLFEKIEKITIFQMEILCNKFYKLEIQRWWKEPKFMAILRYKTQFAKIGCLGGSRAQNLRPKKAFFYCIFLSTPCPPKII